jgi:hypothetical protein
MKCDDEKCEYRIIKKDRQNIPKPMSGKGKNHVTKFKGHGTCILGRAKRIEVCGDKNAG